ncbi:hypothetical protein SBOR_5844 [Sclerotinia borealis F-4128]|uniref:Uncharacterized protein n=1 Tax=Sclerotinia borealis (strain F-4128) TaxID=1432307 RepID=W9CD96_SCLBF|nr:hypothetical protein SBOR_5844 [Sclerotinia borealis F-4128]
MGRSRKTADLNANMEPLGSRVKGPTHKSRSLWQEEEFEDLPRSRSRHRSKQTSRRARSSSKSPRRSSHYRPRSRSPCSSRRSRRFVRSVSPRKDSSSGSYESRSYHDGATPRDRGVSNSDYYRPSYTVRSISRSSETKGQALSLVSSYNPGESLDDKETPVTETWAEIASRKHRELAIAASNLLNSPSPIEESWVEIAGRKHREIMSIAAANAITSAQIPVTTSVEEPHPFESPTRFEPSTPSKERTPAVNMPPVIPTRDARSSLSARTKLRQEEGLDLQRQISSLIYNRKNISPAKPKVGITVEAKKEVTIPSTLIKASPQHSGTSSTATMPASIQDLQSRVKFLVSAPFQGMHPSRQSLLNSSPVPLPETSPEDLYIQVESRLPVSPPKTTISTAILQTKIQELRRASSSSEAPKPIPSVVDESFFADDPFYSEYNTFEPVIPTHWQD